MIFSTQEYDCFENVSPTIGKSNNIDQEAIFDRPNRINNEVF